MTARNRNKTFIINSGNDYLITVKANQKTLHRQIATHCQVETPIRQYQKREISRDRSIERSISGNFSTQVS